VPLRRGKLGRVSTYSVVVAVHIIAAFAAYGLPAAYPLVLPYLRRHHPEALPGVHAIQYRLNVALTGPFTIVLLAAGIYLAADGDRWGEPFTTFGLLAVAIIAVVGGAVIVPATKHLAALAPDSPEYAAVFRRYLTAEIFLAAVVVAAIFMMAVQPG
jgi:uncharacterized membrane protein